MGKVTKHQSGQDSRSWPLAEQYRLHIIVKREARLDQIYKDLV